MVFFCLIGSFPENFRYFPKKYRLYVQGSERELQFFFSDFFFGFFYRIITRPCSLQKQCLKSIWNGFCLFICFFLIFVVQLLYLVIQFFYY